MANIDEREDLSMLLTTEHRTGLSGAHDTDTMEPLPGVVLEKDLPSANGKAEPRRQTPVTALPAVIGDGPRADGQPVLAAFCYADPASAVGQFVARMATALARRG